MKSRMKMTSTMLLIALVFSLVPAMTLPTGASAASCDWAQFITDVTVPDGTKYEPGATFKKTWRLKNIGTCTWTTSYSLVFDTGAQMGAPASIKFPSEVKPGETIDINVDMTAPTAAGHYIGYWKFKNTSGVLFGIGYAANRSWWVEINVTSSNPSGSVVYDFAASAKDATWSSGAGGLSFPGKDGDAKGFALTKDKPKFESGVELSKPGLLFAPQNITNGFIQAEYPAYKVDPGDYFQTTVGCEFGATSCYVAYRLDYKVGNTIKTFWTFRERYEGWTYNANFSLAPLAGQEVKFILYMSAYGSPIGDRALWGNPVITRKGIVPPPPTVTGTPPTATPSKTPAPVTQTVAPSSCDKVQFVADVNFPDGSVLQPGAQFTKTWRLKNVGSCAWSTSYELVFFSGEKLGAASSAKFPKNVAVGETVDVSINMTAPTSSGSYRGYWMFKNADGALFGIGSQANKPWWVDIKVTGGPTVTPGTPTATATQGGPTVTPSATSTPLADTAYDFAVNACDASWHSGAGPDPLACPGTDGDAKGFVLKESADR
ncbi:MAG TPA: NBR1-Ig-like domain-containing protein, partial [Anaerolineales bacterium]|nr:NBR1-Ig-like domain-containing protein [Anaerolineales bacterium]